MSATMIEIPGLAAAQAELAIAVAAREALRQRGANAAALVKSEQANRTEIVRRMAEGDDTAAAEIQAADDRIRAAKSNAAALEEALTKSDNAAERANAKIVKAQYLQANREFISATKAHIAIMEEAEEMGRLLEAWLPRMKASEARMHVAMGAAARNSTEERAMIGNRHDLIAFIPRQMQSIIVQAMSCVNYTITDRSRGTWGRAILDARQKIGGDA